MLRYDRTRFLMLGLLPLLNVLALLLYGLGLATHGSRGGAEDYLPLIVVIAGILLLIAIPAIVRRGRDIGFPAWGTVLVLWFTGPVALLGLLYLALAGAKPGADRFGPAPPPAGLAIWVKGFLLLVWPWMIVAVVDKIG